MNAGHNQSHFNLLFNNCADFARVFSTPIPRPFRRSIFPDAGMTTPKQIAYKLVSFARKHPDSQLAVFEIPQVPGYRRQSHPTKASAESLITTGYAVPIVLVNPYLAGGLFVDYLVRGRFTHPQRHPSSSPANLSALTSPSAAAQNPDSAGAQAHGRRCRRSPETPTSDTANSGLEGKGFP